MGTLPSLLTILNYLSPQYHRLFMETETVKLPKALPNTLRKVMPTLASVVATKLSQGKKDLEDP
jgi:hypothetical protein